ncbi:hypothetical protein ABEB36_011778 [Hypothenemus hampei]|uniref:DNA repair endonuclease XPF n=1 Tax=Hypothenemus hampei TaxID=57062 RepID=A0ABD1E8Z8_HYPHA
MENVDNDQSTLNDTLLEKVDIEYMLEFETQIFLDIVRSDGLIIAAKGLSLDLIILNILKVYQDPGNLVFVLNSTDAEQKYFDEKLKKEHIYIEHDTGDTRIEEYLCGGIHFVPTRILVVDLLKKRIPIEKITGIIILRAHRIIESCNEAFVLKLFRQHNKTGFIKAFSNSPQSFTMGFCHVERVMRSLFLKELHIWPRFHTIVRSTLKQYEPQVVELHLPISDQVKKLQTYILDIMNGTVKELKRLNPSLELQEITVENCLTKKFHKLLQGQMNEIWHQLSSKSTRLLAELKTLRHLLLSLFYSDSITFYSTLLEYRKADYARTVDWVLSSSADLLFRDAGALVYSGDKVFDPEFSPKWEALLEILTVEIPAEIKHENLQGNVTVLILCSDQRTCHQLNEILTRGPYRYLFFLALKMKISFKSLSDRFKNCNALKQQNDFESEEEEDFQSSYALTMSQSISEESEKEAQAIFTPIESGPSLNTPTVLIQTFKGGDNYVNLQNNLLTLKPNFVVMYHSDVTAVRELEMYEAHRQGDIKLKIFFLIHASTVEEQAYLTALRREKEAFEYLIETKASMVVPEYQDGKSDQCVALSRGDGGVPERNTRKGGGENDNPQPRLVIVDMREFRSDLPSLIHKRGLDIEPLTISVGDYILTPEICVERKSVSDLISSLNSGRLYQQCLQMQRYYAKPMLLIEFDQNKAFGWKSQFMISQEESETNFGVQEKLLLLTIHFPKLKIIWSPSPYATAQLFEELKQGKDEPTIESTVLDDDLDRIETKYNSNIYDFIQKLPGVTSKNIETLLRNGVNIQNVIKLTEEELKVVLNGSSNEAKLLYDTLHTECQSEDKTKKDKSKSSKGYPRKRKN